MQMQGTRSCHKQLQMSLALRAALVREGTSQVYLL